jgi:hypothetical protein
MFLKEKTRKQAKLVLSSSCPSISLTLKQIGIAESSISCISTNLARPKRLPTNMHAPISHMNIIIIPTYAGLAP